MKKGVVIGIVVVLVILAFFVGYSLDKTPLTECEKLSRDLDGVIRDINNPPGTYRILGNEGIVGGTLLEIIEHGFGESSGYYFYELIFQGEVKRGSIFVHSDSDSLDYLVSNFYRFDLADKRGSGALSGGFIDHDSNKLTPIVC